MDTDVRQLAAQGAVRPCLVARPEPVRAVADGTVVLARDGLPDIPPMTKNPDLQTPRDYAGNNVIVALGHGRYAVFDHLERG